jgi:hypothetical protein
VTSSSFFEFTSWLLRTSTLTVAWVTFAVGFVGWGGAMKGAGQGECMLDHGGLAPTRGVT